MSKHELGADRVFHEGAGYKMKAGKAHGFNRGMKGRQQWFSRANLYNRNVTVLCYKVHISVT